MGLKFRYMQRIHI